jgi:hypothetical protein
MKEGGEINTIHAVTALIARTSIRVVKLDPIREA